MLARRERAFKPGHRWCLRAHQFCHLRLGQAQVRAGDVAAARQALRQAMDLAKEGPIFEEARRALQALR